MINARTHNIPRNRLPDFLTSGLPDFSPASFFLKNELRTLPESLFHAGNRAFIPNVSAIRVLRIVINILG
jgi:hypothetical protein